MKHKSTVAKVPPEPPAYISVTEAAEMLRLSEVSIRRFLTKKILGRYKAGARTLLLRDEVMGLIKRA